MPQARRFRRDETAGYFVANFTIHDQKKFEQYWALTPSLDAFGARLLVRERNSTVLQGEPHQILAVFEFESVEAVKRWYESPEYQAAVGSWVDSVDGWAVAAGDVVDLATLKPSET